MVSKLFYAGLIAASLLGSAAQAVTVGGAFTGPRATTTGTNTTFGLTFTVTPSDDPILQSIDVPVPVPNLWDTITLSLSITSGAAGAAPILTTLVNTDAPILDVATLNSYDFVPVDVMGTFDATYTDPGIFTQAVTGTATLTQRRMVEVRTPICRLYIDPPANTICLAPDVIITFEEQDVVIGSTTFNFSQQVTVTDPSVVPLPASVLLLLASLAGLGVLTRPRTG